MYISMLLSFTIFIVYLFNYIIRYGIPDSLSATYYKIKFKPMFTLMMFTIGFTLIPALLEFTPENYQFLAFLAISGILFTGAAPMFLDKHQGKVHFISAGIAAISALLWIIFVGYQYLYILGIATLLGVTLILINKKAYLFYLEMIIFFSMYIIILLYLNN